MSLRTTSNRDAVFHRQAGRDYPIASSGHGAYLIDSTGKEYLDAAGGVFVVNLGHGTKEVAEAMAAQAASFAFANTANFTSAAELEFAERLTALAPEGFNKAWICTSGSQANETAIKLARSYHLMKGEAGRIQVVSRWNSYHGSSLGALSLTGHTARRAPFAPYLFSSPKIEPPYCYRCPLNLSQSACGTACADLLDDTIRKTGTSNISAFILEVVSGGPLGALVAPDGYLSKVRAICDRHGILMIVDEVITGAGRTGMPLAIAHSGVVPDIITLAKGIGGGFVPVGAVLVHDRVFDIVEASGQPFRHGETFTGHSVAAAAGSAVLNIIARDGLVEQARLRGERLGAGLRSLANLSLVGDVRGIGLLWGIEIVADKVTKQPFSRAAGVAERIAAAAFEAGLIVIAGTGCADGEAGDTITLAPPFVVTESDIDLIISQLGKAIEAVGAQIGGTGANGK